MFLIFEGDTQAAVDDLDNNVSFLLSYYYFYFPLFIGIFECITQ